MPRRATIKKSPILPDEHGFKVGPNDLKIVVNYQIDGWPLNEEEKRKFIGHLKREHYYHSYLSRKFSYTFIDYDEITKGVFVWKGGNGDHSEASFRVLQLLATQREEEYLHSHSLLEGVSGRIILSESSPYVAEIS